MNFAAKLITIFLLLSIVPLSLVGYLAFVDSRHALEQDTIDRLLTTTQLKAAEFTSWLDDSSGDIRLLAQRPLIRQYTAVLVSQTQTSPAYQAAYTRVRQDHLLPYWKEQGNFLDFSLIRATDGLILASTNAGLEGKYREDETFFIEGRKETYVGNVEYEVTMGGQAMYISTPVTDENGAVIAVLVGHLNLGDISDIMMRRSGLRKTEETYLVNTFNFMVTQSRFGPDSSSGEAVYSNGVNNCLAGHDGSGFYDDYRGVPVIGAYQWIPERQLCIVTEMDQSEALAPVVDLRNSILLIGGIIGLSVIVTGVFFARTITGPVRRLVKGTEEIGKGNLAYRVGTSAKDEIGQLSRAFDHMIDALKTTTVSRDELAQEVAERKKSEEALRQSEQLIRSVIDATPDWIFVKGRDFCYTLVNRSYANAIGVTSQEMVGKDDLALGYPEELIFGDPERGIRGYRADDAAVFEHGEPLHNPYDPVVLGNGKQLIFDTHKLPLRHPDGEVWAVLGVARDITERWQSEEKIRELNATLEQRVTERTAQLEASNKELEAFSYSVSHDLRAPLRAMDGFSRILIEEYTAELPGEAQRYLRLVRENAQQMGSLIDHLLAFSRLGRQPLKKERVEPAKLVQNALDDLSAAQEGREITVTVGDLPPCWADPTLLRQVFANLLGNAFKFTKTRNPAIIEVGSDNHTGEPVYFVKDNGVGFDMQYANKLFGVFQRLHRAEEYEGSGVGLATVQRIILRHGGRIWAEGEVDQGATFYFTLGGEDTK
jgi:PAS domain S-box-containing protein